MYRKTYLKFQPSGMSTASKIPNFTEPSPVEGIYTYVFDPDNTTANYSAKVQLFWNIPCISNGEIEMFILEFSGRRKGDYNGDRHSFMRLVCVDGSITVDGNCYRKSPLPSGRVTIQETELRPDYDYKVYIEVKNYEVSMKSKNNWGQFSSKAGLPEMPSFNKATTQETDVPSSSVTIVLKVENLNDKNGVIERSALLVQQVGCVDEEVIHQKITDYCTIDNPCPKSLSWSDVAHADCTKQYQTTNEKWNIVDVGEKDKSSEQDAVHFTIGSDKCAIDNAKYCNGPLKPSTEYNVTLRIFTKNSYRDIHITIFATGKYIF